MQHDEFKMLSKYRLDNAKSLLITDSKLIEFGDFKSLANRSYYAIFNAMRAELALLGKAGVELYNRLVDKFNS